jgi:Fe-S oxidoreductase
MMDTRDRMEEVGEILMLIKAFLFQTVIIIDYIYTRRIMGLYPCNACVEECPVNISPLSIIMDMRRYLVMEQRHQHP